MSLEQKLINFKDNHYHILKIVLWTAQIVTMAMATYLAYQMYQYNNGWTDGIDACNKAYSSIQRLDRIILINGSD